MSLIIEAAGDTRRRFQGLADLSGGYLQNKRTKTLAPRDEALFLTQVKAMLRTLGHGQLPLPDDYFSGRLRMFEIEVLREKLRTGRVSPSEENWRRELRGVRQDVDPIRTPARGEVFESLVRFALSRNTPRFALMGAPGDGKTEIITYFLRHTARHCFDHAIYVDCRNQRSFPALISLLHSRLCSDQGDVQEPDRAIDAINEALIRSPERWLIVFDNFEMVEDFEGVEYHALRNDDFSGLLLNLGGGQASILIGTTAVSGLIPEEQSKTVPRLKVSQWREVLLEGVKKDSASYSLLQGVISELAAHELPGTFMTVAKVILACSSDKREWLARSLTRRLHRRQLNDVIDLLLGTLQTRHALVLGLVSIVEDGLKASSLDTILSQLKAENLLSDIEIPETEDLIAECRVELGGLLHFGEASRSDYAQDSEKEPWLDVHAGVRKAVIALWEHPGQAPLLTIDLKRKAHRIIARIAESKTTSKEDLLHGYRHLSAYQRQIQTYVHYLASLNPADVTLQSNAPENQILDEYKAALSARNLLTRHLREGKILDVLNADAVRLSLLLRPYHAGFLEPPPENSLSSDPSLLPREPALRCAGWADPTPADVPLQDLGAIASAARRCHQLTIASHAVRIGLPRARLDGEVGSESLFLRTHADVFNLQGRLDEAEKFVSTEIMRNEVLIAQAVQSTTLAAGLEPRLALLRNLYVRRAQSLLLAGRIHAAGMAVASAVEGPPQIRSLLHSDQAKQAWSQTFARPRESRARWLVRYAARIASIAASANARKFVAETDEQGRYLYGDHRHQWYLRRARATIADDELRDRTREHVGILLDRLVVSRARIVLLKPHLRKSKAALLREQAVRSFRQIEREICLNRVTATMDLLYRLERARTHWFIERISGGGKSDTVAAGILESLGRVAALTKARGLAILECEARLLMAQLKLASSQQVGLSELEALGGVIERHGYGLRWAEYHDLSSGDTSAVYAW